MIQKNNTRKYSMKKVKKILSNVSYVRLQKILIKKTVKSFCEFTNKLVEIFQWIMLNDIPFVANAVFIC